MFAICDCKRPDCLTQGTRNPYSHVDTVKLLYYVDQSEIKEYLHGLQRQKRGLGLEMRSFKAKDGRGYLVFRTSSGSFHVFAEVEAKEAARQCGGPQRGNTRQMWEGLWSKS